MTRAGSLMPLSNTAVFYGTRGSATNPLQEQLTVKTNVGFVVFYAPKKVFSYKSDAGAVTFVKSRCLLRHEGQSNQFVP